MLLLLLYTKRACDLTVLPVTQIEERLRHPRAQEPAPPRRQLKCTPDLNLFMLVATNVTQVALCTWYKVPLMWVA